MATTVLRHTVDNYWKIVKHLSPDAKIDLITMLSQSLKEKEPARVSASKYYGVWGDDSMTDDEFVSELKSLRSFNKEIVEL
jgi:antirestriction protein